MAETTSSGSFWGDISSRFFKYLDYTIDDAFGLTPQPNSLTGDAWGNWYPETTAPNDEPPVEPGFKLGNNAPTWGLGLLVLGVGFLVVKAVK